ncbi:TonB-dependent receptor [Sphingomonas hylomeconis]|uniref:TonB-dependent receptor n=1 Tax=Sphingomonas hylomeconis TaxID=1395958 RepID=A0ABV7STQ4_9SPHN|nr:TonB-dependent receptor [Sphingomonas hylomeconis]
MTSLKLGASLIALTIGAAATPGLAQDTSGTAASTSPTTPPESQTGLEDIVVTAQRRSENVQRAALSVTAVSGDDVRNRGVTSTEQLSRLTAGLQVQPAGGPYTTFTIRSVTQLSGNAFADPSVAVNINGVYLATPTSIRGLYYDLERLEILKGPQGTLYGRNATAGAINLITSRPGFTLGGNLGFDVGNYNRLNVNGALNLPLSDTVALRIAGQRVRHTGYMSDGTNDEDAQAVRASLLFKPSTDLSVLLTADWSHEGGKGAGATLRKTCASLGRPGGSCFVADPYTGVGDLGRYYTAAGIAVQTRNPFLDDSYLGFGLNADLTTGAGTVSLVASYRKSDVDFVTTATSWQIREKQHPKQKSVELRLAAPGGQRLQYVFGAYYLDTIMHAHSNSENGQRRNFSDAYTNTTGWTAAAFSQLSYEVVDHLRAVGGIRYTYEEKASDSRRYTVLTVGPDPVIPATQTGTPLFLIQDKRHYNRVNWKAGLEFDAGRRNLLYANVSTGFKAGGFYSGPPGFNTYAPEEVTSFVLGSKNRFLDNRLQFNAEAFYLNYHNQQVSYVKLVGGASTLVTENVGQSRAFGLEAETEFLLTPTTRLFSQLQYLDAKYKSFVYQTLAPPPASSACTVTRGAPQSTVDCSGQTPLRSPRWTLIGRLEQSVPLANGGRLVGEAGVRYETRFQNDVSYLPESEAYATARVDMALSYLSPGDRFTLKAYVDNLTNVVSITDATMSTSYPVIAAYGVRVLAPRTFGVRGSVKF